jgi:hypothetical protein
MPAFLSARQFEDLMNSLLRLLVVAWGLAAMAAGSACAAEPIDEFLTALRAGKYYDEALSYLDELATGPLGTEAIRERLDYERGVTLLAAASEPGDPQLRGAQLDEATAALEKFASEHADHPQAGAARNSLAGVLVERGRRLVQVAPEAEKDAAAAKARNLFGQARAEFTSAEKTLTRQLGEMPKLIPPSEVEMQAQKQRLSGELAQARLMQANIDFETARAFPAGSAEAKQKYEAAAKAYADLHEAYRTRTVGVMARLWEGRCRQSLGQFDAALTCFGELLDLPDSVETRSIRTKSMRHAMECWTEGSVGKYQAAIDRGERWTKESGGNADEDELAIRYLTAVAYQRQAEALPEKDPNRRRLASSAREAAGPLLRESNPFQQPAKVLLASLSGGVPATNTSVKQNENAKAEPPKTFAEALAQAKPALEQMQKAAIALDAAREKGDKAAAADLEKQRNLAAGEAMRSLELAMRLREKDTSAELLASARYYQCFLNWLVGNYYDAAVVGEYLALNYPDTLPGRQGAKIALAAWVRLYGESKTEDRSFEIAQIERVAEMTFQRWPDQDEAEEAALTLVNFAAAAGKVERAAEYLNKIPADSPRRGQAELRAGQALWSQYLKALRQPESERPPAEQLAALRKQAREVLEGGIERVKKAGAVPDATLATAVFSLAQLLLEADEPGKAITWLEEPTFGPLTLVKAGSSATAAGNLPAETYKLAMRAYIATNPPQLDKAEAAMTALEKLVPAGSDSQAADNLTAIYVSLGRQLQQDMQQLRESGQAEELDRLAAGFQVFLDRLLERGAGGNLPTLNWMAETYLNLASGIDGGARGTSQRALDCYAKAAKAYEQLLAAAAKDPKLSASPDALLALKLKQADAYRGAGLQDEAIRVIAGVLREKPTLLPAQVVAANIYQSRGAKDPTGYAKAIMGGEPGSNGQNLIWGWAKLSKATMSDERFAETFHKARLAIVESRYGYAMAEKNPQKRENILKAAIQDVEATYKVRPDLGGEATRAKYDQLLKTIQKALGQPEVGLKALEAPEKQPSA